MPELGHLRDVVFTLKMMMGPTADDLPESRAWNPTDGLLDWTFEPVNYKKGLYDKDVDQRAAKTGTAVEEGIDGGYYAYDLPRGSFTVRGFGGQELRCVWPEQEEASNDTSTKEGGKKTKTKGKGAKGDAAWYGSLLHRIRHMFFTNADALPRSPPSMANPSFLLGKVVETEDDILFVDQLPDFDGRIPAHQCEELMQYLTSPYLRLPLCLRFFANQERTGSLAHSALQELLDCVMFEPGEWRRDGEKGGEGIEMIPPPVEGPTGRRCLATPLGMLMNELQVRCLHNIQCVTRNIYTLY